MVKQKIWQYAVRGDVQATVSAAKRMNSITGNNAVLYAYSVRPDSFDSMYKQFNSMPEYDLDSFDILYCGLYRFPQRPKRIVQLYENLIADPKLENWVVQLAGYLVRVYARSNQIPSALYWVKQMQADGLEIDSRGCSALCRALRIQKHFAQSLEWGKLWREQRDRENYRPSLDQRVATYVQTEFHSSF